MKIFERSTACFRLHLWGQAFSLPPAFQPALAHVTATRLAEYQAPRCRLKPWRDLDEVLRDALALPPEARAALIGPLIESLDPSIDKGVEEAWRVEIDRRLQEIDTGAIQLIPWEEARRRLRSQLDG